MMQWKSTYSALLIVVLLIFGSAAGVSAADRKILVKVPGIT